jgi:hypothetical protein
VRCTRLADLPDDVPQDAAQRSVRSVRADGSKVAPEMRCAWSRLRALALMPLWRDDFGTCTRRSTTR